jgi:hypothetical protein
MSLAMMAEGEGGGCWSASCSTASLCFVPGRARLPEPRWRTTATGDALRFRFSALPLGSWLSSARHLQCVCIDGRLSACIILSMVAAVDRSQLRVPEYCRLHTGQLRAADLLHQSSMQTSQNVCWQKSKRTLSVDGSEVNVDIQMAHAAAVSASAALRTGFGRSSSGAAIG